MAESSKNRPVGAFGSRVEVSVQTGDPNGMWNAVMRLPAVERFMKTRWPQFLPPCVATTFLGVALAVQCGLTGDEMRKSIADFAGGVFRAVPPPEQQSAVRFIEKRFRDYYGEYEKTPAGVITVLSNLGLVLLHEDGCTAKIPEELPTPEDRLNLCMADAKEPVVFKARFRDDAGPRHRVMMDQVPAIRRMLNAGWARHLPPDLAFAFMAAAAVSAGKCTGKLMWENIQDLWEAQRQHKYPLLPPRKAEEVEQRFLREYGQPCPVTSMGAVLVLFDLGLLAKTKLGGEEYIEVPDDLPTPDKRLVLSDEEKHILAERLNITL